MGAGTENSPVKMGQRVGIVRTILLLRLYLNILQKWMASTCDSCEPCLTGHDACCGECQTGEAYTVLNVDAL